MTARTLNVLGAGIFAALALTGCMANTGVPAPEPEAASPPDQIIAFEPVAGIPDDRSTVLAEELVTGAIDRGITVVPRDSDDVTLRLQGHFSAARAGSTTRLTYVWDIFDREERRVHRLRGTETVDAGLPDPWQAVTDEVLRRAARQSVTDLAGWLDEGAPATAQAMPPVTATAFSGHDGVGDAAPVSAEPGEIIAASAGGGSHGRTVHLEEVTGAVSDGGRALPAALAARLAEAGLRRAPDPSQADFRITGEATVGPSEDGVQKVAVVWSVDGRDGRSLGTVRQINRVAANQLDEGWGRSAHRAAQAATPGILALMEPNDDPAI